jgi:prolyl oligopeptidase PreP (S9A serine peptidase family)
MDNSNFNIIYESLLNEVNAGIYSSKEIKQLKDVALSKWNILLNKLESYKGSKLNIVLNDNLINEFKDGICDIISFGGCDWNIVYNFEFLDESFLNPAYIGAKFNPGEYLIGFLTSGNIINSTSYKQDLIEHKKNFNKNNSCKFTLSININVDVDCFQKNRK